MFTLFYIVVWLAGTTSAHLAGFHKGMYCLNGTTKTNQNANDAVTPLYNLPIDEWWFHHINKCDLFPPAPGEFLELPAGGNVMLEIADNQGHTSLSFGGRFTSEWPDGNQHPEFDKILDTGDCITSPNYHAQNKSMAAGTALAISYESDISKVKIDNLAVFSVRYHTPWKKNTFYDIPAEMPSCPSDGCICAWLWVPDGCGIANMYMQGYKCKVTNSTSNVPLAQPKPPTWCEGAPQNCTQGAKQMIAWHQKTGNNMELTGLELSGVRKSPGYNSKCGFKDGAQNDIFQSSGSSGGSQSKRHSIDEDNDILTISSETNAPSAAGISSHRRNTRSVHLAAKNRIPHW